MAGALAAALLGDVSKMNLAVHSFAVMLRITQLHIDVKQLNGAGEMVLENFLLMDRSIACIKLFVGAYRQVKTEGVGAFAFSCFIGISFYLYTAVIYLYINRRSSTTAWISDMAIFGAAGGFLMAMNIPDGYAWYSTAVEAVLVFFTCLDAILAVINRIKERGSNENLLRDLFMVSGETLINVYMFADYLGRTRNPWHAEKILHLFGGCMSVLSGLGQIGWIVYKYLASPVFDGGEEQPARAAIDSDVEQQTVEETAEVVEQRGQEGHLVSWGRKKSKIFAKETEISAGTSTDNNRGGHEKEEVPPEEETSPAALFGMSFLL